MELKVLVDDMPRVVCGVSKHTTAEDICRALAVATGQIGRFVLIERRGSICERRLARDDKPLKILEQWGEFAHSIQFILRRTDFTTATSVAGANGGRNHHHFISNSVKQPSVQHNFLGEIGRRHSATAAAAAAELTTTPHALKFPAALHEERLENNHISATERSQYHNKIVTPVPGSGNAVFRTNNVHAATRCLNKTQSLDIADKELHATTTTTTVIPVDNNINSGVQCTDNFAPRSIEFSSTNNYAASTLSSHAAAATTIANNNNARNLRNNYNNNTSSLEQFQDQRRLPVTTTGAADVDEQRNKSKCLNNLPDNSNNRTANSVLLSTMNPTTITKNSSIDNSSPDADDDNESENSDTAKLERVIHGEELEMKRQFLIAQLLAMQSELDALDERTGKCDVEILNWHRQINKQAEMLQQLQQQVNLKLENAASHGEPQHATSDCAERIEALKEQFQRLHATTQEYERQFDEQRHACDVVEHDISEKLFASEKLHTELQQTFAGHLQQQEKILLDLQAQLRQSNLQAFLNGGVEEEEHDAVDKNSESLPVATNNDAVEAQTQPPEPPVTFAGDHNAAAAAVLDGVRRSGAVHLVKKRLPTVGAENDMKQQQLPHAIQPRVVMLKRNAARNPEGLWV